MHDNKKVMSFPHLLTREQAAQFLGIDPKTFDKHIRPNEDLDRFMIGSHERYTMKSLKMFVEKHSI